MRTLTDLLENLSAEQIMQIWGDPTITNVKNSGIGKYEFEAHTISHGEMITSKVTIMVDIDNKCAFLCTLVELSELNRQPCEMN